MVLPNDFKKFFTKVMSSEEIPNLLLSSPTPGTGKTTVAKAIVHDLGAECLYLNASSENSIDVVRNQIAEFAQTMSFSGGMKIVILDEADGLTPQFQKALRAFIEEFQSNCRFILTCNYIAKIIPALRQGRTMCFDFNMGKYKDELIPQIVKRVEGILKFKKIEYEADVLPKLVESYFPSIRQVIATLQQYAEIHGKIDSDILSFKDVGDDLANMILEKKKLSDIRAYIEQQGMDYTNVCSNLFEHFVPKCNRKANAIILIAQYQFQCTSSPDPTIQIAALIVELFTCI